MIAIGVPAESAEEPRIGLSPETAKKLAKLGAKVRVRSGAGLRSHFSDEEYKVAGADIVTSDADLYQCLSPTCQIWNPRKRRTMTESRFRDEYGIPPRKWKYVKALAGCLSDGVPGLGGIGEPTALAVVSGRASEAVMEKVRAKASGPARVEYLRNLDLVTLPHKWCVVLPSTPKWDGASVDALEKAGAQLGFSVDAKAWAKQERAE